MYILKPKSSSIPVFILAAALLVPKMSICQKRGMYPPFTKWYQDPLAIRPLQLSTAAGFLWSSAAVAASLIFTKKDSSFQRRISFYNESGWGDGYKPPYTCVFQNDVGVMYKIRNWMTVGLGWNAFRFKDKINNTWSFGIRPFTRWHLYDSRKTSVFFEYGAGLSYSLNRFPLTGTGWEADTARTGTKFNLTSKYSIGLVFHLSNRISIQTGIRHFHLSNGNLAGIQRNPSHDSNGGFIGIIYTTTSK